MHPTDPAITIRNLHFGYNKNQLILRDMNLEVVPSSIYGFLGANGAGKSTTIRSILGLLRPHSGGIEIFGQNIRQHRKSVLRKVGALIESPSLYGHLSGIDNLRIACKYLNVSETRISEVLELVNLQHAAKKRAKQYSTGMKQRLGLAIALLSDPDLLILDEPVNGLDPSGIIEIRHIIKALHQRGKTIFLSSHILSEIEKIATRVGIIKEGTMVFQGSVKELEQLKKSNMSVRIVASDAQKITSVLNGSHQAQVQDAQTVEALLDDRESLPQLIQSLVNKGVDLYEVTPLRNDLEKLFINLTSNAES